MKNKLLHYFLALLTAAVVFTGCKDDNEDNGSLVLSTENITLKAGTNDDIIVNVTSASDWSFEVPSSDTWLIVNKTDNTLAINAESNPESVERTTTVTVKNASSTKSIAVTQKAAGASYEIELESAEIEYLGVSSNNYTAKIALSFIKDNMVFYLVAFDDLFAIPSRYKITTGDYTSSYTGEQKTFMTPEIITQGYEAESYVLVGDSQKINILEGSFTFTSEDNNTYKFTATLFGEDTAAEADYQFALSYEGIPSYYTEYTPDYDDFSEDITCAYYGDYYTKNGMGRYWLTLTGTEDGEGTFRGSYLRDLYDVLAADPDNSGITPGIYRISDSSELNTIIPGYNNGGYLLGAYVYEANSETQSLTSVMFAHYGTVIVENDGIKYTITAHVSGPDAKTGEMKNAAYKAVGSMNITNKVPKDNLNYTISSAYAKNYGDKYQNGTNRYILELNALRNTTDYGVIYLDICTPAVANYNDDLPVGTYSVSDLYVEYSYVPGHFNPEYNSYDPSQIMCIDTETGGYNRCIYILEGDITITKDSSTPAKYSVSATILGVDEYTNDAVEATFTMTDMTFTYQNFIGL